MGTDWTTEDIDGKKYTAQEISARTLHEAEERCRKAYLGDTVTDAVITVPAYFNDAERHRHQGSGPDRRPRTCCASSTSPPPPHSPTASTRAGKTRLILVFDLGGGTFDVSLLEDRQGRRQLLHHSRSEVHLR
jgi:molecular chaperone DnaK